jgi:two-component system LytT family response regulator
MFRAIIIDDEINGINALKLMIEKYTNDVRVVATSTEPLNGLTMIEDYKPDIVFLDISMPKMTGFELLEKLSFRDFRLIFTTAHEEYALRAIKNNAYDYLLKPLDIDELRACIERLVEELPLKSDNANNTGGIIEVAVRDGIIFIKPHEIIRLEASGSYTVFHLTNNVKHVASRSLKEYEQFLDPRIFYRCHISNIINLGKVKKLVSNEGLFALMEDGSIPEVSKRNKEAFLERLKSL